MTNYYPAKALGEMAEAYEKAVTESKELFELFIAREYAVDRAAEFAKHGVGRRLNNLLFYIETVFKNLPPESVEIPQRDCRKTAEMAIQAFIINLYGCVDNLAWVWAEETELRKPDGSKLPNTWIGLWKVNKCVRESLPPNIVEHIEETEKWFANLETFRHSLAHRIPLYIAPYIVTNADEAKYQLLEKEKWEALKQGNVEENKRLDLEQKKLTFFRPWYSHSFSESSPQVVIHPQMITDLMTINQLGRKLYDALDEE